MVQGVDVDVEAQHVFGRSVYRMFLLVSHACGVHVCQAQRCTGMTTGGGAATDVGNSLLYFYHGAAAVFSCTLFQIDHCHYLEGGSLKTHMY